MGDFEPGHKYTTYIVTNKPKARAKQEKRWHTNINQLYILLGHPVENNLR